jgi:hypothetical protein
MKPPVLGAIALIIGLAAGTGAKVMTTHPAPPVADSTRADSLAADSLGGEGGEHVQQAGETHGATDTAVVASGAASNPPIDVTTASPIPKGQTAAPTVATQSNAATFAAALEARVDAAKTAAEKAAAKKAAAPPPVDTALIASQRRVAKIFTSMDAKAAAKVLEQMNDNDIHIILGYVGAKQAAAILSALPPERVAKLSKLEMGSR